MQVRDVEERYPLRQALLEIYVAVVLKTPYNDFNSTEPERESVAAHKAALSSNLAQNGAVAMPEEKTSDARRPSQHRARASPIRNYNQSPAFF
jgi:hypothetical protein